MANSYTESGEELFALTQFPPAIGLPEKSAVAT